MVADWGSLGVAHDEQNLAELNALLLGQGREEGVFGLTEGFVGGCESALSGCSDGDEVPAAVGGVPFAFHEPVFLERWQTPRSARNNRCLQLIAR